MNEGGWEQLARQVVLPALEAAAFKLRSSGDVFTDVSLRPVRDGCLLTIGMRIPASPLLSPQGFFTVRNDPGDDAVLIMETDPSINQGHPVETKIGQVGVTAAALEARAIRFGNRLLSREVGIGDGGSVALRPIQSPLSIVRELDQPTDRILLQYVRSGQTILVSISRADIDDFHGHPMEPSSQNFFVERDLDTLLPVIAGKFEKAETTTHTDRLTGRTLPLIELTRADLELGLKRQKFGSSVSATVAVVPRKFTRTEADPIGEAAPLPVEPDIDGGFGADPEAPRIMPNVGVGALIGVNAYLDVPAVDPRPADISTTAGGVAPSPRSKLQVSIAQNPGDILSLALLLEGVARDRIEALRGANDPETIERNKAELEFLTTLADGLAQITAALQDYASDPQPVFLGKAAAIVRSLADELRKWWEAHAAEATDLGVRFSIVGLATYMLNMAGADMLPATTAIVGMVGGEKAVRALRALRGKDGK